MKSTRDGRGDRDGPTSRVAELLGVAVDSFDGGEAGALARTVQIAEAQGARGQPPFAALVAHRGIVIGAGVNSALTDRDPTAHAEVTAIRYVARRTEQLNLEGAIVYSSCEPCALCRIVAAMAGVREIVFAASASLVPIELNPSPEATAKLSAAVSAQLPGIARKGETKLHAAELSAPFEAYLRRSSGGPT